MIGGGRSRRTLFSLARPRGCPLLGLLLLAVNGEPASLCLRLETAGRVVAAVPAAHASELRLSFRHSIYGSSVEELFEVAGDGLRPVRLSYEEPRLAEFYGRDGARYEGGVWVAIPERRSLKTLHLRVSLESSMRLSLDSRPIPLGEIVEPGDAVSIAPGSCPRENDAR